MAAGVITRTVQLPAGLHQRTNAIAKRLACSFVQIVREGLADRLDYYDARFKAEDDRARAEKEARRASGRTLRSLGERPLAPAGGADSLAPAPLEPLEPVAFEGTAAGDGLEELYRHHAARIFEVMDKLPTEKRLRVMEAIAAVQRQAPLTHPSDKVILERLEAIIVGMRDAAPPVPAIAPVDATTPPSAARFFDELVGRVVDAAIPTFGDVETAAAKK